MKRLLPAMVTFALLLIVGPAASQDAAPSNDVPPAATLAPRKAADVETEPPELEHLAGSYTLFGNQADSVMQIKNAIDAATAEMGGLKKNVARKRLEAVNKAVTRIEISRTRKSVTVGMNDYVVTVPLDGGTIEIKTPAGEIAQASFQLKTATLVQDIVQTKGRRENTFRFNSDGNLVMQVRETSPQLASSVSYSLVFRRGERQGLAAAPGMISNPDGNWGFAAGCYARTIPGARKVSDPPNFSQKTDAKIDASCKRTLYGSNRVVCVGKSISHNFAFIGNQRTPG